MFGIRPAAWIGVTLLSLASAGSLVAQSAQRFSVQASGLYVGAQGEAFEGLKAGPGFEVQGRFTPSLWSLGIGAQASSHSLEDKTYGDLSAILAGVFIEPRRVIDIGSSRVAPYVSARVSYLQQSIDFEVDDGFESVPITLKASGTQVNAGGGLLIRMSPRLNLDLGATYGLIRFGDVTADVEGLGTVTGLGKAGRGQNFVGRVGLAIGIGG